MSSLFRTSRVIRGLAAAAVVLATAAAAQGPHRATAEIERDLAETKREYRQFESLRKKLERAARQTSNTARVSAVEEVQDFIGECIVRRERDLGEEITIKQHGQDVATGTTDVVDVGSPVPASKRGKGAALYDGPNAGRLRQLSHMKSLYVSAKSNGRPAAEQQEGAWDRYMATVQRFGDQLVLAISKMEIELDKRRDEADPESAAKPGADES